MNLLILIVYKVPNQPSACGILQVIDGYIGHEGQYSALHEGCHCAGFASTVCKSMCDRDDQCKGYSEVAEGYEVSSGCQIATNSSCYSGCIKTNLGNLGDLVQDKGHAGMFGGCFIRTLDSSGSFLLSLWFKLVSEFTIWVVYNWCRLFWLILSQFLGDPIER